MKMYLKCHVIHHYLRVREWMCKMIDVVLVLGGAWQRKRDRKWQWRLQIKGRRGWTEKGPTHKRCRQGQTWAGGGGAQGDKKWRERRREQEMPVCRWEAWKPEGNLNRLWLPLRHDRLLIPIPSLFLTHSHTHMQAHAYIDPCTHKPVMHVGTQSYSKKIKQAILSEHKCAGSRQKSLNCAVTHIFIYICKISRFSKVSTPLQQKPWKATGERPARGCLSKQQFTYTHLCSCTLRLQGTCRSVTVKT